MWHTFCALVFLIKNCYEMKESKHKYFKKPQAVFQVTLQFPYTPFYLALCSELSAHHQSTESVLNRQTGCISALFLGLPKKTATPLSSCVDAPLVKQQHSKCFHVAHACWNCLCLDYHGMEQPH